jgi:hypothetical protein
MVRLGPEHAGSVRRLAFAILCGLLVSWFGVVALIMLIVAWPRNPTPRVLLLAWAVLAAGSLLVPGARFRAIRRRVWLVVLAIPFLPLMRAALAVWPHLPGGLRDGLQGNSGRYRRSENGDDIS